MISWRATRAEARRFAEQVRNMAQRYGAAFQLQPKSQLDWTFRALFSLEVDVGEARVYLEGYRVKQQWMVDARARFIVPAGPSFKVKGEGLLDSVIKEYSLDPEACDATLGHPAFDQHFLVQCTDPDATRRVWSEKAQATLVSRYQDAVVSSDGKEIKVLLSWQEDPPALEPLIELLGELAAPALFEFEAFTSLPEASYLPPAGPWRERTGPRVRLQLTCEVILEPLVVDGVLVSRVQGNHPGQGSPLELGVLEDGRLAEPTPAGSLPAQAMELLPQVGPGILRRNPLGVTFTWHRLETNHSRLLAGARLVDSFARSGAQGIYR